MPRLIFSKTGDGIWLSHLDTMRLWQRAFSRAGLRLRYSQGFSPKPQLSAALPLSVGIESLCELLEFRLEEGTALPEHMAETLNGTLPAGFRVMEVYEEGRPLGELKDLRTEITLEYDRGVPQNAPEEIGMLFSRSGLMVSKFTKKGQVETDILPMIRSAEVGRLSEQELCIRCVLSAREPSLNPMLLRDGIERYLPELTPDHTCYRRMEMLDAAGNHFR